LSNTYTRHIPESAIRQDGSVHATHFELRKIRSGKGERGVSFYSLCITCKPINQAKIIERTSSYSGRWRCYTNDDFSGAGLKLMFSDDSSHVEAFQTRLQRQLSNVCRQGISQSGVFCNPFF